MIPPSQQKPVFTMPNQPKPVPNLISPNKPVPPAVMTNRMTSPNEDKNVKSSELITDPCNPKVNLVNTKSDEKSKQDKEVIVGKLKAAIFAAAALESERNKGFNTGFANNRKTVNFR